MKRIILLVTLLIGLTLVACQKDDVKQAVATPEEKVETFTQAEIDYFNEYFNSYLKNGYVSNGHNINPYLLEFTVSHKDTPTVNDKFEVKKKNGIYLLYCEWFDDKEKTVVYPSSALRIQDLFSDYDKNAEKFSDKEEEDFRAYINAEKDGRVTALCAENHEEFEVQVLDKEGRVSIYTMTLWISKGKYVFLDETGIVATKVRTSDNDLKVFLQELKVKEKLEQKIFD